MEAEVKSQKPEAKSQNGDGGGKWWERAADWLEERELTANGLRLTAGRGERTE